MDNGERANFRWLDEHFADSRFVLNTRPLFDLVLSHYDMVRESRVNAGCKPEGSLADCSHGILSTGCHGNGCKTDMINNNPYWIRRYVRSIANSQAAIAQYFYDGGRASEQRRRRFVQMNVCKAPSRDTLARLFWALRPDLAIDADVDPVSPHFPMETKYVEAARQAGLVVSAPHANSRGHGQESIDRVNAILQEIGCGHCHDRERLAACQGCPN